MKITKLRIILYSFIIFILISAFPGALNWINTSYLLDWYLDSQIRIILTVTVFAGFVFWIFRSSLTRKEIVINLILLGATYATVFLIEAVGQAYRLIYFYNQIKS